MPEHAAELAPVSRLSLGALVAIALGVMFLAFGLTAMVFRAILAGTALIVCGLLVLTFDSIGGVPMPDKQIVQKPVSMEDLYRMTVSISDPPQVHVTYRVMDQEGNVIGTGERAAEVPLTQSDIASLNGFIHNVVLPAVNAVEGT